MAMNEMLSKNLLVELFVEELPPKALKKLGEAFTAALLASLRAQGLAGDASVATPFASPRRLAAHVTGVAAKAADRASSNKLMPVAVALDADGQPTPALLKRLAALGLDASAVPGLARRPDGKAEALFHDSQVPGASLAVGLQKALDEAVAKLPIPKVMTYQLADGWTSVNFVRPVHGLVALHGSDVVPVTLLGITAGRATQGHRFEAAVSPVALVDADHYAAQMKADGAVIASFDERRAEIVRQLSVAANSAGLVPIDDAALLDEVAALVERPNVVVCSFEAQFLDVPQEVLILTMKANQKYFPLLDAAGALTNRFLVVSNIAPADPSRVIEGNERVVRPRLADAKFFFDQDRKKTLESRVVGLDRVVYHNKLGTQGERIVRVRRLARAIGHALGGHDGGDVLAAQADRAAELAKADLLTDMVGEFPELQGTMGRYYAQHDGMGDDVAFAIEDHYKPRFAGDTLPRSPIGIAVALADKLETLAGLFGIGQVPTGDKDPFALRRHALGVIRMLIERELPLSVTQLLGWAFQPLDVATNAKATAELGAFLQDRLTGYLRDAGYSAQEVEAVTEARPERWSEIPKRLAAVRAFTALPEAASLAAANKRVGNILKKSDVAGVGVGAGSSTANAAVTVNSTLLVEPAEQALHSALVAVRPEADRAFDHGDYATSLRALAALKAPVDAFFDAVMVNADDPALRANRLGLLAQLHQTMNRVADISKLAT